MSVSAIRRDLNQFYKQTNTYSGLQIHDLRQFLQPRQVLSNVHKQK